MPAKNNSSIPEVSIVMPVRNEVGSIGACLEAVLDQDYPSAEMEILIADGISTDGTREIIQNYQSRYKNIYLFDNPDQIVSTGLNRLIPETKGAIIARVDGHCRIAQDYISSCLRHLQSEEVDGVGGSIITIGETFTARVIAAAMSSPFGVGGSAFRTKEDFTGLVDTVPFPAYKREIVWKAGLYDEELVRDQDDEYNYRLRALGAKILLAADVNAQYYSRSSLHSLWSQFFQYGFWKVRVMQKHPHQMMYRQFIPPLFVLALLLSGGLSLFSEYGRWLFLLVVGIYLTANLGASILAAARSGWRYLMLLPASFSCLHLSYGTGFLVGLVRFWNRWGDRQGCVPEWENGSIRKE